MDLSQQVPTTFNGDKVQLTKIGNSKIFVVKKKQVPHTLGHLYSSNSINNNIVYDPSHFTPQNGFKVFEEFQNTHLPHTNQDQKNISFKSTKSLTPLRNPNGPTQGSTTESNLSPDKGTPQMININSSYNQGSAQKMSMSNTQHLGNSMKHVNFILHESQQSMNYSNNSKDRVVEHRLQNSKREFCIRKPQKGSKDRLKSPTEFTSAGKSVVSLFTAKSGKTTHSAPLGLNHSLSESPQRYLKVKKELMAHKRLAKKIKERKKNQRPLSCTSSSIMNKNQQSMSMTQNFKMGVGNQRLELSNSKERNPSISGKKIIPLKQIKFPIKKQLQNQTSSQMLPKPPLHKKQNFMEETGNVGANHEALLKMADESIANIDSELSKSRKSSKNGRSDDQANPQVKAQRQPLHEPGSYNAKVKDIQTNFNLSFNNSFNTSYNHPDQKNAQVLAFSSSPANQDSSSSGNEQPQPQFQGYFTHDAIQLEKQLTTRLKEASGNEDKKMQAFNQTFNEIIKRDKNFGSLLLKIKQSYDEYLRKSMTSHISSPVVATPTYEELQRKVESQQIEISAQKQRNEDLTKQVKNIRDELDEKKRQVDLLNIDENDKNFDSFKLSKAHMTQDMSNNDTIKSLQLSNSSRLYVKAMQGQVHQSSNSLISSSQNKQQMLQDLNILVNQNVEMTQACNQFSNELSYLKLREKKIMYLVYVLQSKGYPVNQVFEKEVKPIQTMRFQEFLDNHPDLEEQLHVEAEEDVKALFSFRTEDSFEPLNAEPMSLKKRPSIVPPLNIFDLPAYESSSSEGDPEPQQPVMNTQNPQYYQESLKYIENFYSKYANQMDENSKKCSQNDGSIGQPLSSQDDGLSRDEEDIREELDNLQ